MIGVIDYGLGNLAAFINTYKKLGIKADLISSPDQLNNVTHIILPGVGAFDAAIKLLRKSGLSHSIEQAVHIRKVPILGVCVGMQMMCNRSEEGRESGLGWINADVERINILGSHHELVVPHMGWNDINILKNNFLIEASSKSKFYFLHSYFIKCKLESDILATVDYGSTFTVAIASKNIYGVQFHPEKSHSYGVDLLKNFSLIKGV